MRSSRASMLDRARFHLKTVSRTGQLFFSPGISQDYYRYNTIALHGYNTVYFYITKVACTTLKAACADLVFPKKVSAAPHVERFIHDLPFPYMPVETVYSRRIFPYRDNTYYKPLMSPFYFGRKKASVDFSGYFKFCFVRNPWERIASLYFDKVKDVLYGPLERYKGLQAGMSFGDFVRVIGEVPDEEGDEHFISQSAFVTDVHGRLLVDHVGRFERFEEDWKKICGLTGIPFYGPGRFNISGRKDYRTLYDAHTKKMVAERYKEDLDIFKYVF